MTRKCKVHSYLLSTVAPAVIAAASMATTSPALAQCTGPGTKTSEGATPQTTCLTAIQIPGNALRSFDISWVAPGRAEYYLGDRSNAGIDVIDTQNLVFKRTITAGSPTGQCPTCKFVGIVLTTSGAVNNNLSGPDGVTQHGHWLYAGDGDSTLKVIDLNIAGPNAIVESVPTGGTTRVDEMALTPDGTLLFAANNAEDPPFSTLFTANGNSGGMSNVNKIIRFQVAPSIMPSGFGLSLEQPVYNPAGQRFFTSIPIIANNPPGCNFDGGAGPVTCDGGLLVTDPNNLTAAQCDGGFTPGVLCVQGAFNNTSLTGVVFLHPANRNASTGGCGPNGATTGPNQNLLLGCTPGNNPFDTTTQVIQNESHQFADVANITGSDEVWWNKGDGRYYLGASKSYTKTPVCTPVIAPPAPFGPQKVCAVLGVVDETSVLIETIPQSSNSHSVAADLKRNLIFVPQVAPSSVVGSGGDTTTVGQGICGSTAGCIAVYQSPGKIDAD